ncbi:MAG: ATP-binding protein [Phormidesmis sp.]
MSPSPEPRLSQWNAIFADDMMTVTAIAHLVHHALIIEIRAESYR